MRQHRKSAIQHANSAYVFEDRDPSLLQHNIGMTDSRVLHLDDDLIVLGTVEVNMLQPEFLLGIWNDPSQCANVTVRRRHDVSLFDCIVFARRAKYGWKELGEFRAIRHVFMHDKLSKSLRILFLD